MKTLNDGGELKSKTLRSKRPADDLFSHMQWMLELLESAPAGTKALLMSPIDLSQYNKVYFAKIRFADAAQAQQWMDLEKKIASYNVKLLASPVIAKHWAIAIYEE